MSATGHLWSILLAAGDGKRVQPLTGEVDGVPVPKQFYRPGGKESMLRWTISRAADLVPVQHIVPVVASQHRRWWESELTDIPGSNVIVQPRNRGTGAGILLPLLHVRRLDPMARVLILPTDHYVEDEGRLRKAIVDAMDEAHRNHDRIVLVGTDPSENDTECGWIVPRGNTAEVPASRVAAFVEKPGYETSRRLAHRGAVVNTLIMVATADAMLKLFERAVPRLVEQFASWSETRQAGVDGLYRIVPNVDFSHEVLESSCDLLSVVRAVGCGWMDLGTPARLSTFCRGQGSDMNKVIPDSIVTSQGPHPGMGQVLGVSQQEGSAL
jgi:mannose-1-phosphate guanylyltransferase